MQWKLFQTSVFNAITEKTTQRWEGEDFGQLMSRQSSVCLESGVRTQKDLIRSRRNWPLGGDLNAASEETFRRLVRKNTILDLCGTLCGSVIKTLPVAFGSRNGTITVHPISMARCEWDTCFGVLLSCTRALLSSWEASTLYSSPCTHTLWNHASISFAGGRMSWSSRKNKSCHLNCFSALQTIVLSHFSLYADTHSLRSLCCVHSRCSIESRWIGWHLLS